MKVYVVFFLIFHKYYAIKLKNIHRLFLRCLNNVDVVILFNENNKFLF